MIRTIEDGRKFPTTLSPKSRGYQKISHILVKKMLFLPSTIKYNFTISEEKKFVWFRVAKVGTRTILHLLNNAQVKLAAVHPMNCYYPVNKYKGYFKFAFIRNPWDRFVSAWYQKVIEFNYFNFSEDMLPKMRIFENFVDFVLENINVEICDPHLRLQSRLIDLNNIDYLGRFEKFNENLQEVMSVLDINADIEKKNASVGKKSYKEYYTNSTRDKIAKIYRKDISLFNYDYYEF